jgi:hypothetical protein
VSVLQNYWKQLGPVVALVLVVANLLGPKWAPGYAIAAVCGGLINLFGPANSVPPTPVPPPPK